MILMFISPFLNEAIEKMMSVSSKYAWQRWGIALAMFLLFITPLRSFSGVYDPSSGFSPLLLIMLYVTMRLVRLSGLGEKIARVRYVIAAVVILSVSICLTATCMYLLGVQRIASVIRPFFSFYAPPVYCFALVLVAFFALRVQVGSILGRLVSVVSPSMFAVYLVHETTSFGRMSYFPVQRIMAQQTSFHPSAIIVISAVFAFVACLSVDLLRRVIVTAVLSLIHAKGRRVR